MKNKAIEFMKARLASTGTVIGGDGKLASIEVFKKEELETFLDMALTSFNSYPPFTFVTLEDSCAPIIVPHVVQLAVVFALASKTLTEAGREFTAEDNGIRFTPPTVSSVLNTQYHKEIDLWHATIREVKVALCLKLQAEKDHNAK